MKVLLRFSVILLFGCMASEGLQARLVDLVIIGAGPAGLQAALYGAGAVSTLVIAGDEPGGQLMRSGCVENVLGAASRSGYDFMTAALDQVKAKGAEILNDYVEHVDFSVRPFRLETRENEIIEARAVIIATGSSSRKLGVPGESTYWGRGVATCATCDGPFYSNKHVAVIGGGDTAVDEAIQLLRYADKVTFVVRAPQMRAQKFMRDKLDAFPGRVDIIYTSEVKEILGNGSHVTGLQLKDLSNNECSTLAVDGVFLAVGHMPNSYLFKSALELDHNGYIVVKGRTQTTSIPGVFAAGEIVDPWFKQACIEMGSGGQAALEAVDFIRYGVIRNQAG